MPGPGGERSFSGTGTAMTLETVGHAQVKCTQPATTGEYTGAKTASLAVTLTGCKLAATKESCQSTATPGEVRIGCWGGKIGFTSDTAEGTTTNIAVGLELGHEPTILTAQCGAAKESLAVTGAVIGSLSPIDKMTLSEKLLLKATGGKPSPAQFEGAAPDTLLATCGTHAAEEAGLDGKTTLTSTAKLQVRAKVQ